MRRPAAASLRAFLHAEPPFASPLPGPEQEAAFDLDDLFGEEDLANVQPAAADTNGASGCGRQSARGAPALPLPPLLAAGVKRAR